MTSCCPPRNSRQHLTVHDCFERGLTTRRLPPLPVAGESVTAANGLWAAFSVHVDAGRLQAIHFDACTCTTLIAYCQALVDLNRGRPLEQAAEHDSRSLIASLPGVPTLKHDRALVAAAAFRAACNTMPRPTRAPETGGTK